MLEPPNKILKSFNLPGIEFSQCPSDFKNLQKTIKTRNTLVKQLNNIQKVIEFTVSGLEISNGLIISFSTLYNTLKNLPLPSSTGVPGVPGLLKNYKKVIQLY